MEFDLSGQRFEKKRYTLDNHQRRDAHHSRMGENRRHDPHRDLLSPTAWMERTRCRVRTYIADIREGMA